MTLRRPFDLSHYAWANARFTPSLILFSLGLMRTGFIARLVGIALALGLSSCTTSLVTTADLYFTGRYRLGASDLHELERAALAAGVTKPIRGIHADSPDRVQVECGMPWLREKKMILFSARRRNGHWFIDKASIKTHDIITLQ